MLGKPWWLLAVFGNQCPGMLSTRAVAVISTPARSHFGSSRSELDVWPEFQPEPGQHFFVTLLCQTAFLKFAMPTRKPEEAFAVPSGKDKDPWADDEESLWKHEDDVVNQCRALWTEHMPKRDSFVYSESMSDGFQTEVLQENDQLLVKLRRIKDDLNFSIHQRNDTM